MASDTQLYFAPVPKKLSKRQGSCLIASRSAKAYILLEGDDPQSLVPAAKKTELGWEITASPKAPKGQVKLVIRLEKSSDIPPEGYKLVIRPERIEITASSAAGAFYGACTFSQIIRQCGKEIPCLMIEDWPDFTARGVMLDISRDKVPTIETLYHLVDLLADWKINQLQLYTEHTFAYLAHPAVWEHASPMTGAEIMALDAYCKERFIELVPNQNSFGHMTRWLIHDKYRPMAEAPNGCDTAWGYFTEPFSLCATDRRCVPFLEGLFDELLPHFTSTMLNIGGDETVDLGRGRSKKACETQGIGRVYMDFLMEIYWLVKEHGCTMQFWGDIIMHHPELIPELPKDIIALEWGYEAAHPFKEHCAKFGDSGIPFYVCPGTSSWNSVAGRTQNAVENITNAARNGVAQGAVGLLNTDWGDCGHWQPLSVAYLGYLVGAMASWNAKPDVNRGLAETLSIHAFGDSSGKMGKAFLDLGNIYLSFKKKTHNCSIPWQMLFRALDDPSYVDGLAMSEFEEMESRLKGIASDMRGDKMTSPDARIVKEEFKHLLNIMDLSVAVGKMRLGRPAPKDLKKKADDIRKGHEHVWLLRNRPGGLADSLKKLLVE